MIDYVQRVEEHPCRNLTDNLLSKLEEVKSSIENLTDDELSTLNRIEEVYKIMLHRIDTADPLFVSSNLLNGFQRITQEILNNLNAFHQHYETNVNQKNNHYQKVTQEFLISSRRYTVLHIRNTYQY